MGDLTQDLNVGESVTGKQPPSLKIIHIADLNPYSILWKITAKVVIKTSIFEWIDKGVSKKSFAVHLLDDDHAEIRCVFYDKLRDFYYDKLMVNSIYDVANCKIAKPNANFNDLNLPYELRFNNKSSFEINDAADKEKFELTFDFTEISRVQEMAENLIIDCIAIIWNIGDLDDIVSKTTLKKYVKRELIDASNNSITLSIWDSQARNFDLQKENCVIACKRVKIQSFEGIKKLTTRASSIIYFDYHGPCEEKLNLWIQKNLKPDIHDDQTLVVTSSEIVKDIAENTPGLSDSNDQSLNDDLSADKSEVVPIVESPTPAKKKRMMKPEKLNHTI